MKILYVVPSLRRLGPVNVCFSLIDKLCENNIVHVIYLNECSTAQEALHENSECIIKHIPFFKYRQFVAYVKNNDFDIIHSHCLLPDILVASLSVNKKRRFKTFSTIHNYIDVDYMLQKGRVVGKIMGLVNRFALKKVDCNISCSESVKVFCNKKFKVNSIYIRNGVPDQPLYKHYGVNERPVHFFFLGVLNLRKNAELILKSFVKYNNSGAYLHVIGDGPELDSFKVKYSNKNIVFYGRQNSPLELTRNFDVFVSMALAEGLPLALLESLSIGKPYICSNIAPHKEVHSISRSGIIIESCESMLIDAFKTSERWCLNEMSLTSRESYVNNFTTDIMAKEYYLKYLSAGYKS